MNTGVIKAYDNGFLTREQFLEAQKRIEALRDDFYGDLVQTDDVLGESLSGHLDTEDTQDVQA